MPQANMEGQFCEQEPGRCESLSEEGSRRIVIGDCPMSATKGAVVVEERGGGNEGAHHDRRWSNKTRTNEEEGMCQGQRES